MTPRRNLSRVSRAMSATAAVLLLAGCQFSGLNSLALPGTSGHGRGSFRINVELPDVGSLPQNSPVMLGDVTVGSIAAVAARQRIDGTFYAEATLALDPTVVLPADAKAMVAQTSLLGSQHLELVAPAGTTATGILAHGTTIPIERAGRYASTEEVLSALGVVVNKGNLGALTDITDELYQATAGRAGKMADLIPNLAELAAAVDNQTGDIISTAEHLARSTGTIAARNEDLDAALRSLPGALEVLNGNGTNIVDTFAALRRLADVAARVLAQTKTDFAADAKDAYAAVKPIADNSDKLVDALPILPAFPLPVNGVPRAVRGDYLNAFVTLDLTSRRIGENLLTTSGFDPNMRHLSDVVNPPDLLIGQLANLSGQAVDPFQLPAPPARAGG